MLPKGLTTVDQEIVVGLVKAATIIVVHILLCQEPCMYPAFWTPCKSLTLNKKNGTTVVQIPYILGDY